MSVVQSLQPFTHKTQLTLTVVRASKKLDGELVGAEGVVRWLRVLFSDCQTSNVAACLSEVSSRVIQLKLRKYFRLEARILSAEMEDGRTKKLENIIKWNEYYTAKKVKLVTPPSRVEAEHSESEPAENFDVNEALNDKVSIWQGDITILEIDAIVNAANRSLAGGGGVDGAIHRAAGRGLFKECETIGGCQYGDAKITKGYKLPAKHVIHTVGPRGEKPDLLKSCYSKCFTLLLENGLRSIAFPCIATGIYGYPNENAAHIALKETRKFLTDNGDKIDRVIFCIFLEKDLKIYERLLQYYFPIAPVTPIAANDNDKDTSAVPAPASPRPSTAKSTKSDEEGPSSPVKENETSTLAEKDSN